MKKCPYCAEEIQDEAIKCRYCGEFLNNLDDELDIHSLDDITHPDNNLSDNEKIEISSRDEEKLSEVIEKDISDNFSDEFEESNDNHQKKKLIAPLDLKILSILCMILAPIGFFYNTSQLAQMGLQSTDSLLRIIAVWFSLYLIIKMNPYGVFLFSFFQTLPLILVNFSNRITVILFPPTLAVLFFIYSFFRINSIISSKIQNNKSLIVAYILLILMVLSGYRLQNNVNRVLDGMVYNINKIGYSDEYSHLDTVFIENDKTIVYNYTLVHSKNDFLFKWGNSQNFKDYNRPIMLSACKSDKSLKYFRENNIDLNYKYMDKNELELVEFNFINGEY